MRWFVAVLTLVGLAGCATRDDVAAGDTAPYQLPAADDDADRYGSVGVAPLLVVRGSPAPAGTPYYVTIGFAAGRPTPVDAIDSRGAEHPSLRSCEVDTSAYASCLVYVMPPGTELVGLVLRDMS